MHKPGEIDQRFVTSTRSGVVARDPGRGNILSRGH
jgi:hypothetical protein